jgi:hypothetical protein
MQVMGWGAAPGMVSRALGLAGVWVGGSVAFGAGADRRSLQTRRARWRLSERSASLRDCPWACLRARKAAVSGSQLALLTARRCRAQLSCRLPPRSGVARGGGDRRGPARACELGVGGESVDAGDLADQLGCRQRAASSLCEQLRRVAFDQRGEFCLRLASPGGARGDLTHELARPARASLVGPGRGDGRSSRATCWCPAPRPGSRARARDRADASAAAADRRCVRRSDPRDGRPAGECRVPRRPAARRGGSRSLPSAPPGRR